MVNALDFLKNKKSISLIIQTTQKCNLRCKHCYESECEYLKSTMSIEVLEKIISLAEQQYTSISFLWFGGEPLMAGLDFYKKVVELQNKYRKPETEIRNSVQTNAVLLDDEFIAFFLKNSFNVSVSYDCQYNDFLRQKSDLVVKNIRNAISKGLKINVLSVLHANNYKHQKEMIEFLTNEGIYAKFNRIFSSGEAAKNSEFLINDQCFVEEQKKEFSRWIAEEKEPMHPFFRQIIDMVFKTGPRECSCSACLFKWVSFDPTGMVYTCPRFVGSEYCFGNIMDYQNLYEIFENKKYLELASKAIERKEKCKQTCNLYSRCKGGCNAVFYETGNVTENQSWVCTFYKEFIPFMLLTIRRSLDAKTLKNESLLRLIEMNEENFDQAFHDFQIQ